MNVTREQILEKLKAVQDPELKRDIVSLGMVQNIAIESGKVLVQLTVTTPSAPVKEEIRQSALRALSGIPGILSADIQMSTLSRPQVFQNSEASGIGRVIAVASGKGGVGKTTAAVNLALALAGMGYSVGLMDGDIYGPNVPLMLGVSASTRPEVSGQEKLIPIRAQGIQMISMGVLVPPDQPMVWRGPMLHSAVTQFIQKVEWGKLDFLLVDLPPGTGDVQLSLVQTVPLAGAVIVTTPQEVALMDVRKGIAMFQKTSVPILGILENMTGEVFGEGGGLKAAQTYDVPFLGSVPLDPSVRHGGDQGRPVVVSQPDSPAAAAFVKAAETVCAGLETVQKTGVN